MAEVFLAKTFGVAGFEKMIALKRILPTMAEDRDFIEMFIDEAKIAGQLSHASIVPIYELGRIGESHYIAMEYVWGKDLLQLMNRCRKLRMTMSPGMVAYIAARLCEGLDYAHNRRDRQGNPLGLIHRDISPQNVLIGYEAEVKLIDFGIAKATSRNTKTQAGVLKGKFGYMSPEQIRGKPLDGRSDCFAVGTCMYEMLTSDRLFLGESDFTTLEKVRNADVRPPSEVVSLPAELESIIMRALTREPEDRWPSASAMQQALQVFLAKQPQTFGRRELSAWMNSAFSEEQRGERQRLDSYANVGRAMAVGSTKGVAAPAPVGREPDEATINRAPQGVPLSTGPAPELDSLFGDAADDDDETILSASPFAALLENDQSAPSAPIISSRAIPAEKTQVFFSMDEFDIVEEESEVSASSKAVQAVEAIVGKPLSIPPRTSRVPSPVAPPSISARNSGVGGDTTDLPPTNGPFSQPLASPLGSMPSRALTPALGAPPDKGHFPWKAVTVTALSATILFVALGVWLDRDGSLDIRTIPASGAVITVNGDMAGMSPASLELGEGSYALEVNMPGYQPETRSVQVNSGETTQLELRLTPIAEQEVAAAPSEAAAANQAAPPSEAAAANQAAEDPPEPEPEPEPAPELAAADAPEPIVTSRPVVAVEPTPPAPVGAPTSRVAARAQMQAQRDVPTPIARNSVPTPPQRTETRTARPEPRPTPAVTAPPRATDREAAPAPRAAAPTPTSTATHGTLNINTIPWSNVTLDGRPIGRTPIFNRRVRSGSHRIQLETTDGTRRSFTVSVPGGETVRFTRRFE
jgi:serine/threonine protein kinase